MEEIRIQKFLSSVGITSRRAAENEILNGNVKVNGKNAELGQKIIPGKDRVTYCGKPIDSVIPTNRVYIMLNKPRGYVTTLSDDKSRKCVADLVKDVDVRVYPIGRLDMNSEGLLLFTNDGDLSNKLTHPKHHIPKIYHVKISGDVSADQLCKLGQPMMIDDYLIQPVKCDLLSKKNDFTIIRMELYEGRNRQIRKMCDQCDLKILRLQRVAIGNIKLGNLSPGKWRYLTKTQIDYLKKLN